MASRTGDARLDALCDEFTKIELGPYSRSDTGPALVAQLADISLADAMCDVSSELFDKFLQERLPGYGSLIIDVAVPFNGRWIFPFVEDESRLDNQPRFYEDRRVEN